MRQRPTPQTVEAHIQRFSKKGHGLGEFTRADGTRCLIEVPFTMPGDTVRALVMRKRSGVYPGRLDEILQPAPERIVPRCVHFGKCGGCRWQEIPYESQLAEKELIVRRSFGPLLTKEVEFHPILPCLSPWQYRNKMEFSFSSNLAKEPFLGLMMEGSKGKVLNLTTCHLTSPWFVQALGAVREWWMASGLDAFHPMKQTGSLRTLTLREGIRTGDRLAMLTVSGNPDYALTKGQLDSYVAALRQAVEPQDPAKLSIFLRIHQAAKGMTTQFYEMQLYGPDHIRETLYLPNPEKLASSLAIPFWISPTAFFQPNTVQAEKLYAAALEMAKIPKDAVVYDLYCGTGTLGICAAKQVKQVIGIELSPEAVLDAKKNAADNGLSNIQFFQGDVGKVLAGFKDMPLPNMVMVDPPRMGLDDQAIAHIVSLRPKTILYVSCNPATQATNIQSFIQSGYRLVAVQPVDQFPHTVHIENIAVLVSVKGP